MMLLFGLVLLFLGDFLLLNLGKSASRLAAMAGQTPWVREGPLSDSVWPWRAIGGLVATIGLAIVVAQVLASRP